LFSLLPSAPPYFCDPFQVVVIQSLCLLVYAKMEQSKFVMYFQLLKKQQHKLEKKLAHLDAKDGRVSDKC